MLARKEEQSPAFTLTLSSNGFMEIINIELQVMTSTIQEMIKFCDHNIRLRGRNANARNGTYGASIGLQMAQQVECLL